MRKIILMSILVATAIVPWWFSREKVRRRGLRWTIGVWVAFIVIWALYAPRLFFLFPPTDE